MSQHEATVIDKRLFISGISSTLSREELEKRINTYVSVVKPVELNTKLQETKGIFAHCSIKATPEQWNKLKKLSGAVLKGAKLSIADAKPDWQTLKLKDQARPEPKVPNPRKRPAHGHLIATESKQVKRGICVRDSDISQRNPKTGWTKGRTGKAIAVLKRDGKPPLKINPTAYTKLWGTAHPDEDDLTGEYDEASGQWFARNGRAIRDKVIRKKAPKVESTKLGRVEVWESEDEQLEPDASSSSERGASPIPNDEEIALQLTRERALGMSLLDDILKDTDVVDAEQERRQKARKKRNTLAMVQRYDPNAPDTDSDADSKADRPVGNHRNDQADSSSENENGSDDSSSNSSDTSSESSSSSDSEESVVEAAQNEPSKSASDSSDTTSDSDSDSDSESDSDSTSDSDSDSGSSMSVEDTPASAPATTAPADFMSIFKSSEKTESNFKLFGGSDEEMEEKTDENAGIHPDRLAQSQAEPEDLSNSNYTVIKKDRGFLGRSTKKKSTFPLLLSAGKGSIWDTMSGFLSTDIDVEEVTKLWEAAKPAATKEWKNRKKDAEKRAQRSKVRQGRI